MEPLLIREFQPQDWPQLMEIHDAARKMELALAGLPEAFVPLSQAAENEGLFDYQVSVCEKDGQTVGFTAYSDSELAWLYVDPTYMRQGIGARLIAHVLEHSERPLFAEVLCGNQPALGLYQAMGFEVEQTCSGVMPGNESFTVTAYCLVKK